MSLRALLNQPVTIVHPADTPAGWDWSGPSLLPSPTLDPGSIVPASGAVMVATFGRLDQLSTVEESTGWPASSPDSSVSTFTLFLGPAEVIRSVDRVIQGNRIFEVAGRPNQVFGRRGVHHLEVSLRCVQDDADGGGALMCDSLLFPSLTLYPSGD